MVSLNERQVVLKYYMQIKNTKGEFIMKNLKFYVITEEQYNKTEYRPLDVEITEIETEDGWNYGDIIENNGDGYAAEIIHTTSDGLIIWKIANLWDEEEPAQYIVEIDQ